MRYRRDTEEASSLGAILGTVLSDAQRTCSGPFQTVDDQQTEERTSRRGRNLLVDTEGNLSRQCCK